MLSNAAVLGVLGATESVNTYTYTYIYMMFLIDLKCRFASYLLYDFKFIFMFTNLY